MKLKLDCATCRKGFHCRKCLCCHEILERERNRPTPKQRRQQIKELNLRKAHGHKDSAVQHVDELLAMLDDLDPLQ